MENKPKKEINEVVEMKWMVVLIVTLTLLCAGEPDLLYMLIKLIGNYADKIQC